MSSSSKKSYTVVVPGKEKRTYVEREVDGVWIGIFGGWYEWNGGRINANGEKKDEEAERLARLYSGVVAMEAEEELDEEGESILRLQSCQFAHSEIGSQIKRMINHHHLKTSIPFVLLSQRSDPLGHRKSLHAEGIVRLR
jgi:hypothetical protein